jgi:hypothetical protein
MSNPIDMVGQKYGRLTVIEMAGHNKHKQRQWRCVCDCGTSVEKSGSDIRSGNTLSCGCLHKELLSAASKTHGMSKMPIWSIHRAMMDRCYLTTSHAYNCYGGRGITVCERWQTFENFFADMGNKPTGMSLEREDNNGGYNPENVQWATAKDQANNRRSSRWIEFRGETKTLAQWCEVLGLKVGTVWARLSRDGYSVEEAFTKPIGRWS